MLKTDKFDKFIAILREELLKEPDFKELDAVFKSHGDNNACPPMTIDRFAKIFEELDFNKRLEEIAKWYPEFNISLKPWPKDQADENFIEDKQAHVMVGNSKFFYDLAGRLYSRSPNQPPFEIDEPFLYNGIPIFGEIKLGKFTGGRRKKESGRIDIRSVDAYLQKDENGKYHYEKKQEVFIPFFEKVCERALTTGDVSEIFVVAKNVYDERQDSKLVTDFEQAGGFVLSYYTERQEFLAQLKYNLTDVLDGYQLIRDPKRESSKLEAV